MCQCNYCQREAKFKDILLRYNFSEEDKKFLEEYQNYSINESFDREIAEAKESSLVDILKVLKYSNKFTEDDYEAIFSSMKKLNKSLFLREEFWENLR